MDELENNLKLKNWLSIVTYDVFKYVGVGGVVSVAFTTDGLTVTFSGVKPETEGINKKFQRLLEHVEKESE